MSQIQRENRKLVTIRDVAAASGFSTQTISRVINDHPDVSPGTRKHVAEVIERLKYRPNALARGLRQHNSLIGVVIAGLQYIGPSYTLNGIASEAEKLGYHLLLKEIPDFTTTDVKYLLDHLLERRVEGIIWAVPQVGDNYTWLHDQLIDLPVPIVFLASRPPDDFTTVEMDNRTGGRIATTHLLEQGYRHIGHITGPIDWTEEIDRRLGWEEALANGGLACTPQQVAHGNWSAESGERAMEQLLAQYPAMDAVFVANDQMALGALNVAHRRGIRVPEQLGVVGFDGIAEAAHFWPPLTTVFQDSQKRGSTGTQEIVKLIQAVHAGQPAQASQHLSLPVTLIERESSRRVLGNAQH